MTLVQWLASGGAYGVLGLIWAGAAIAWANHAGRLGRRYDSPNDGCLLGFACVVLALLGGAVGLLSLPFPWFLVGSATGAIALPALASAVFARRMRKWAARPRVGEFTGSQIEDLPLD